MWNKGVNASRETLGVLTSDGNLLFTSISSSATGGSIDGVNHIPGYTGVVYAYPTQNNPMPTYAGTFVYGQYYCIPISATIHTHTPCVSDGTHGITGMNGVADFPMAGQFKEIKHYVIGCNAVVQFDNNSYFNLKSGPLSSNCNDIR